MTDIWILKIIQVAEPHRQMTKIKIKIKIKIKRMIIKKMPLITIMILIKNKIKKNFIHIILNINKKDINIHKYNYFIPFIFNLLGKDISPDAEPIVIYSFNMLILSLIVLFCFINIFVYFMALYLIKRLVLIIIYKWRAAPIYNRFVYTQIY